MNSAITLAKLTANRSVSRPFRSGRPRRLTSVRRRTVAGLSLPLSIMTWENQVNPFIYTSVRRTGPASDVIRSRASGLPAPPLVSRLINGVDRLFIACARAVRGVGVVDYVTRSRTPRGQVHAGDNWKRVFLDAAQGRQPITSYIGRRLCCDGADGYHSFPVMSLKCPAKPRPAFK